MKEYKARFPIVVEIVEEKINLDVEGNKETLHKEYLISFESFTTSRFKSNKRQYCRLNFIQI